MGFISTPPRSTVTMALAGLSICGLLTACGGEPDPAVSVTPTPQPWVNPTPQIFAASPAELSVGENLTVLGNEFVPPAKGQVELRLTGTFFADDGSQHPVTLQKAVDYRGQTEVRWALYPNIVFHPNGDRLGRFVGQLSALNIAYDGTQKASTPYPITITVKPSLIPRLIAPVNATCAKQVITDTLQDQPMLFTVEAIGFRAGAVDKPLRFYWTFPGNQWEVSNTNGTLDDTSIYKNSTPVMLIDDVKMGATSSLEDGGDKHFVFQLAQDLLGMDGLKKLRTRSLPDGVNDEITTVNVAVVDATGKSANLVMPLTIRRIAGLIYDGNEMIAERYPAQPVTDCIPGGNIGREVSYHETTSESRSRSLAFDYRAELGANFGLPSNPVALGLNFSAGFGKNISDSVSSEQSNTKNISAQVLPGHYAVCYRQTVKVHRIAQITGWNACGEAVSLGDAILTDWSWSFDISMGRSCMPASTLPPPTTGQ